MSDTDVDTSIDPSDFVLNEQRASTSNVLSATEDEPDRVARAYELGKETDSHPALVYANLDNFEQQHKASLTSQLLNNSSYLRQYVEDPMKAKLSHDDLGPMDATSDAVSKLNLPRMQIPSATAIIGSAFEGAIKGAKKGFGDTRIGESVLQSDEDFEAAKDSPLTAAAAATVATPLELILRSLSGGLEGAKEAAVAGAETAYKQFGGSDSEAQRFSRGIGELAEFATTDVSAMHKIEPHLRKAEEVIRSSAPWIDAGLEPPAGLHPEIDKIKAKQNDIDLKNLNAATKEAQGSATRERDPDIFADFIRSHTDATIGISADGLQRIYGERVPEAGDNLLGFHDRIANDYRTAVETGGDVQIPLADWLAKVDPDVAKELHDDIRVRPGAITKAELEVGKEQEGYVAYHGTSKDFESFDIDQPTTFNGGERGVEQGTGFFTTDKGLADKFAMGPTGRVVKANIAKGKSAEFDAADLWINDEKFHDELRKETLGAKANPTVTRLYEERQDRLREDYARHVESGSDKPFTIPVSIGATAPIIRRAKAMGLDTAYVKGLSEGDHVLVFNKDNIKSLINEPLQQVRAAAGLEPMFSVGDRKLTLSRIEAEAKGYDTSQMHDFNILDQEGKPVGYINMSLQDGGKRVYIENIEGVNGNWANDLGPATVRDIIRQLKSEFPEATEMSGHRISGMRREAGTVLSKGNPVVKFDSADIYNDFRKAVNDGGWIDYGSGVEAHMLPKDLYTANDVALKSAVEAELKRIAPKDLQVEEADAINVKGSDRATRGAYVQNTNQNPIILWSLNSPDAVGTVRHEAIHHLRNYGFFKPEEWTTLQNAAKSLDWMEKYGINERYGKLDENAKLEEAIADAYKDWANRTKAEAVFGKLVNGPIERIFERIKQLMDAIGAKFKEILGHEPTWDELFKSVDEGKVGSREGTKPLNTKAYKQGVSDEWGSSDERLAPKTPEFKRWFEDSKVVNTGGNPKIVYHGTGTEFDTFRHKPRDGDIGMHFGTAEQANYRIDRIQNVTIPKLGKDAAPGFEAPQMLPVYLSIKNPLRLPDLGGWQFDHMTPTLKRIFPNDAAKIDRLYSASEVRQYLQDKGYDGIIYKNTREDPNHPADSYIAFEPNQIKSAIGNRGTFDAKNPNIKFEVGSEAEAKERDLFARASAVGMTQDQYRRYMSLIERRNLEDVAKAQLRAEKEQTRRQSAEWKSAENAMRPQAVEDVNARPAVAADTYFREGILHGEKIEGPKIAADTLTKEQAAMLPKGYVTKTGLDADQFASAFGFKDGQAMVTALARLEEDRANSGMRPDEYKRRLINAEVERRMQAEYGDLSENILEAAKEQALSETQLDILHEETIALASQAKVAAPIPQGALKSAVQENFKTLSMAGLSSDKFMSFAGKAGRSAEMALLKGDYAEAFKAKQQQYNAILYANEAKALEKQVDSFDKMTKRLGAREQKSIDPNYTNFIHDIMVKIGKPVRRSVQDIQSSIEAGEHPTLESFVNFQEQHGLREVPVAAFLFDKEFQKPVTEMTVDEFRAVKDSITTLAKNGRDELKIVKAGEEADLNVIKDQMIDQLKTFKEKHYDAQGGRWLGPIPPAVAKPLRTYLVSHLQLESIFNRWDRGDPRGVFSQYISRELSSAANYESALEKKYSGILKDTSDGVSLKESVPNPIFKNPISTSLGEEGYLMNFNRKNLRAILLNAGNAENLGKLAKGYGLKPEQVQGWLHRYATKEDWDWGQKIGDMFAQVKKEADVMSRNLSGVEAGSVRIEPFSTPHGEYPGWYYPIIYHPEFEGASKKLMGGDALEQSNYNRASTPQGYTKARTSYSAPIALDMDMMPVRLRQMLHDIAMRPAVINASKIFYDKDVRSAMTKHYGREYTQLMVPYLRDVANAANFKSDAQKVGVQASEFIRQNMISTLIGLNPGTVLKHGPTAAVNSLHEVGAMNFLQALKGLTQINDKTGETNWKFAMDQSEELQRRHRHYNETLGGAQQKVLGEESLRENIIKLGSTPVALSDLLSAVPTWMAQYQKSMREDGATHGDAVYMADRAVRRAHGSTAVTNRPGIVRGSGALGSWMASLYGFFNHIMNRQYELMWKAGDTLGMVKDGDYAKAMKMTPELTSGLFAYVILPALFEEMVTPLGSSDNESWGKKAAKGLAFTLSASWVGIRDIASAMLNGRDPASGLMTTTFKTITDVGRDFSKDKPLSKENAGRVIQHGATVMGAMTGLTNAQEGKSLRYIQGVWTNTEKPRGPWDWMTGLRYGTNDKHSRSFEEYRKHMLGGH